MIDSQTIAELNAGYRCPPDAGPAWRAAAEMGMDMSLIESNLEKTPWDRIVQNDSVLSFVRMLQKPSPNSDGESR
jgi:hypothetical protein